MPSRTAGIVLVALLGLTGATSALLVDHTPPAPRPARLLWFAGRPSAPVNGGVVTTDGTGGVIRVDPDLRAHWVPIRGEGRDIISVAPAGDGGYWLASSDGEILRADREGRLIPFRGRAAFQTPELASSGEGVWAVRSPDRIGFGWYPAGPPPTLQHLQKDGSVTQSFGRGVVPPHALLTDLANAGRIAVSGDTVWYAPFIRDEIVAFDRRGDTLWVASRALGWAGRPPRFEIAGGKPVVRYTPVNLGIALGPDGRLYVLSARDSSGSAGRLDVFDRATGRLLRSDTLDDVAPTLAVDEDGRVYTMDPARVLTGVPRRERQEFPDFDLERLGGGRMRRSDLAGKVTLVNFWASWCAPCRTEMPALDRLRRGITDPEFAFVTIDEDLRDLDGRAFIAEFGFDFPVLFGRGLKERYHYFGLPYTVLLDRDSRIVQRWYGFAGPEQIDGIRAVIAAELTRQDAGSGGESPRR